MEYLTNTSELTAVADAIREKGGTSAPLTYPFGFVSAIQDIQTGGGDVKALVEGTLSGVYENSTVTSIGGAAFFGCSGLLEANLPMCSIVDTRAFFSCIHLTSVAFSECTAIGDWVFYNCHDLINISFPKVQTLGSYTFANCSKLTTADFPECTIIGSGAFSGCGQLETVNFPVCKTIEYQAFFYGTLSTVVFPECETIASYAFYNQGQLATISFPKCKTIGSSAFWQCYNLRSAYFMGSSLVTLQNYNAFDSTPISNYNVSSGYGSIYVPASLLTAYQTATNWVRYSSRFVGV